VKLAPEEIALFDAILAECSTAAAVGGNDNEQLAKEASKRAIAFVAERRKAISGDEPS
jgi:hypothetical protein